MAQGRPESSNRQGCGGGAVRGVWLHHAHLDTGYLIPVCQNVKHMIYGIWVSFCRTGKMAHERHFFLKSKRLVWPNLIR